MLPSFKIVIGTVFLCIVLFAMSGAGVVMPETHTRFGEVPEVGRPMMQRMIAEESAQAQLQRLNMTRRAEQLEELRARTLLELAAQPAPDADAPVATIQAVAIEDPDHDVVAAPVAAGPTPNLDEPIALQPVAASGSALPSDTIVAAIPDAPAAPAVVEDDGLAPEPGTAALEAPAPGTRFAIGAVRLPRFRPIKVAAAPHRAVHRVRRHVAHIQHANPAFGAFGSYQPDQPYQFNQFDPSR